MVRRYYEITGLQDAMDERDDSHRQPDIIEFVRSPEYLNRPNLYPRQGTLLKLIFLQTEIMTDYDFQVIEQWEQEYIRTANEKGEGNHCYDYLLHNDSSFIKVFEGSG